jgi:hypothetical protein
LGAPSQGPNGEDVPERQSLDWLDDSQLPQHSSSNISWRKSWVRRILDLKLKKLGYNCTSQARRVALDVLERARRRSNFGNGGEVENLLNAAKRAAMNCREIFKDDVGSEAVVAKLEGYQKIAEKMRACALCMHVWLETRGSDSVLFSICWATR